MTTNEAAQSVVHRVVGTTDRIAVEDIGPKGWTITLYTVDGDVAATLGVYASREAAVDRHGTICNALRGWDVEIAKEAVR